MDGGGRGALPRLKQSLEALGGGYVNASHARTLARVGGAWPT